MGPWWRWGTRLPGRPLRTRRFRSATPSRRRSRRVWTLVAGLGGGVTTAIAVAVVIYYRGKFQGERREHLLAAGDAASARGALEAEKARAKEREGVLVAEIQKQSNELALRDKERLDALSKMGPGQAASVAGSALK